MRLPWRKTPKHKYYPGYFTIIDGIVYWEITHKGKVIAKGKSDRGLRRAVEDANKSIRPARVVIGKIDTL